MVIATWGMLIIGGYRQVEVPITENIGNLGKLKEAVTLKRGILTEIPYSGGRDFYADLAEVGRRPSRLLRIRLAAVAACAESL